MKQSINTIIRTKLREPEQQEEEEIGLITPKNPKGLAMGELGEPSVGVLPPGSRRMTGTKPGLNPGQRHGSIKKALAEARKLIAAKKAAKKSRTEAPKSGTVPKSQGGVRKPHRFRPGTVALKEIRRYQKSTGTFDQKVALSAIGARDSSR